MFYSDFRILCLNVFLCWLKLCLFTVHLAGVQNMVQYELIKQHLLYMHRKIPGSL